jgi:hypothetical protein
MVREAAQEVLSTVSFRGRPGLKAQIAEAMHRNDFAEANRLLQQVPGIGPKRAEAIVQRLQQRSASLTPEEVRTLHLAELAQNNVKHTPDQVVRTGRDATGRVVFLEQGNDKAGLQHILKEHADHFAARGIPADQIPDAVMAAATRGNQVGLQGRAPGRPIYEVEYNGNTHTIAVTVGNNGFVVGANPATR